MLQFLFSLVVFIIALHMTIGFSPSSRVLPAFSGLFARHGAEMMRLRAAIDKDEEKTTSANNDLRDYLKPNLKAAAQPDNVVILDARQDEATSPQKETAATGTVNDRLLAELQQAADKEKYGAKTNFGKKLGLNSPGGRGKSDEERAAALAEARDLNGVNPVVALSGGLFALGVAAGLWYGTQTLGAFFALHPLESDVYFVERLASVFRNVVMGMVSLASGFFAVTGVGIFMLGVRVAIGVSKGELDPTPIKKTQTDAPDMPNVWDLMLNKKPGRRGRGKKDNDNNNPFGL